MYFVSLILLYFYLFKVSKNENIKVSDEHEQVHLSLTKNPRSMVISWTTFFDLSFVGKKPIVKYGISKNYLKLTKYGRTDKFKRFKHSKIVRYFHKVNLRNLKYNQRYFYKVGDGKKWSKTFSFKTFPYGSNFDLKFCIFGDMDSRKLYTINALEKAVKRGTCQMVIHVGDIAYNLHKDDGLIGDEFMRKIEPIAANIPYMVIDGNHEYDCKGYSHYEHRFIMPLSKYNVKNIDHYYSFSVGLIDFVGISSEVYGQYLLHGKKPIIRQIKWLYKTLENIQYSKKEKPWTIAYLHRPLYCWDKSNFDECNEYESSTLRKGYKDIPGLEKYFYKYNVDLIFSGHEHAYQRNYPVFNRKVYKYPNNVYYNPPAPTHILTGAGGCGKCSQKSNYYNLSSLPFTAKRSVSIGYTKVHVINRTHIYAKQINTKNVKIEDSFWIIKNEGYNMYKEKIKNKSKGKYMPYNTPIKYSYTKGSGTVGYCVKKYNIFLKNYSKK